MKVGLTLSCYPQLDKIWNDLTPLGLGYLASSARAALPGADIFISRDFDALLEHKPDLVGFTTVTHNINYCINQARRVKEELGCPVLIGGAHVSLMSVLDEPFDVAVIGEGEQTFVELLCLYQAEKCFTPQSLAKINGIRYRDESGAVVQTPARAPIQDLDSLPFPDRQSTWQQWPRHPFEASMMSSRGCPYDCYFCSTVQHWGSKYRAASPQYVIRELEELMALHDPHIVHFDDDLFVGRKERNLQIMEMMRERRLHEGKQYRCFVRANLFSDDLFEAFAKTNFEIINVGFESASESVLRTFNKKSDSKRNERAIEIARRHGVKLTASFIFGAPGETRDDIQKTIEFVCDNADVFHYVHFGTLCVLPGTQIWDKASEIGVNEQNLTGIALEPQDIDAEQHYVMNRWPYLNEKNVPREELFTYLQVARQIEKMIYKQYELSSKNKELELKIDQLTQQRDQTSSTEYVAQNMPILDIVKAKARRRMPRLFSSPSSSSATPES